MGVSASSVFIRGLCIMKEIAISIKNVSKRYQVFNSPRDKLIHALWSNYSHGVKDVWALKDINFDIFRGEAVALIGRNGGGKSTLLEILTGTLKPTGGQIKINGRVSALLELGSGFNPEYSGRDNVILNGLLLGLSRKEILDQFDEIEAFAEIGDAIDRPVKGYSSGMIMRLAFAVQILCRPDILIVDEALSVGDFFFQQKCLKHIRSLCEKGVTLLFVSHDMGTVRELCTRGLFLEKGHLRFDGDNLDAIRFYLRNGGHNTPAVCEPASTQEGNLKHIAQSEKEELVPFPLWSKLLEPACRKTVILAFGIYDLDDNPITSVALDGEVKIRVLYRSGGDDPIHVQIVLKNKYDHIVTSVGTFNLGGNVPTLREGQEAVFELRVQLSLEGGVYSWYANLSQPGAVVGGVMLDETPWIGPFSILWKYEEQIPRFYGLVGLNCSARFLQS